MDNLPQLLMRYNWSYFVGILNRKFIADDMLFREYAMQGTETRDYKEMFAGFGSI